MEDEKLYSIGEVSKICNVSKKTLRFYDKINVISPDYISEENKYRYYSRETLLFVPVIKYFKQMGFKLEEMKEFFDSETYETYEKGFRRKIDELKQLKEDINVSYISVKDWYDLIVEADSVIENNVTEVSVKYIESASVCYMEEDFCYNYMESIINIEWSNYLEEIGHAITGPVYIMFNNLEEKMAGKPTKVNIFQMSAKEIDKSKTMTIGGKMMLSAYHIGAHESINETYNKIFAWAKSHGYKYGNSSIERYVTDYWTIRNPEEFVTEVLVEIVKK
jgi:DNA-binding transcriptional MerR regulator